MFTRDCETASKFAKREREEHRCSLPMWIFVARDFLQKQIARFLRKVIAGNAFENTFFFRSEGSRKMYSRIRRSVERAVARSCGAISCALLRIFNRVKVSLSLRRARAHSNREFAIVAADAIERAAAAAAGPICYLSGILSPRSGRNCPGLFRFRVGDVRVHYGGRCNRFAYARSIAGNRVPGGPARCY